MRSPRALKSDETAMLGPAPSLAEFAVYAGLFLDSIRCRDDSSASIGIGRRRPAARWEPPLGNRHFCCQSRQHFGFNGQLAPRPLICALPKPTLVSGKPAKHETRGRLVSSLWKSFTTSKLGSDYWRSVDCGGRRSARATMVLYIACWTSKNSTLPRTCCHHVKLGVMWYGRGDISLDQFGS